MSIVINHEFVFEIIEREIWSQNPCTPSHLVNAIRREVPGAQNFQLYYLPAYLVVLIKKGTITIGEDCKSYDVGHVKPKWYRR